jgi:hypothetical protein
VKLAALGVATIVAGAVVRSTGLVGIGAWWIVMGLLARQHAKRLQGAAADADAPGEPAASKGPDLSRGTFARGTLLWIAIGLPAVLVGALLLGIDEGDEPWRWLPIGVGGLALSIGVLGGLLFVLGSALSGTTTSRKVPATVWVLSTEETGTFINDRPRLAFRLRVEPDPGTGVTAYDVEKKATVPFTAMGSLRVGEGFRATVAGPDDPTSMDISWDQAVGPAGGGADASARLEVLDRLRSEGRITAEEHAAQRARILESL